MLAARSAAGRKLTLCTLSDVAGHAAEYESRNIRDLRGEAGQARLNKSWVKRPGGRRLFRSACKSTSAKTPQFSCARLPRPWNPLSLLLLLSLSLSPQRQSVGSRVYSRNGLAEPLRAARFPKLPRLPAPRHHRVESLFGVQSPRRLWRPATRWHPAKPPLGARLPRLLRLPAPRHHRVESLFGVQSPRRLWRPATRWHPAKPPLGARLPKLPRLPTAKPHRVTPPLVTRTFPSLSSTGRRYHGGALSLPAKPT